MNKKSVIRRASQIITNDSIIGDGGNVVYIYAFTPAETARIEQIVREECLPVLVRSVGRPISNRK